MRSVIKAYNTVLTKKHCHNARLRQCDFFQFQGVLDADDLGFIGFGQEGMGHGHFDGVFITVAVKGQ